MRNYYSSIQRDMGSCPFVTNLAKSAISNNRMKSFQYFFDKEISKYNCSYCRDATLTLAVKLCTNN